MSGSQKLRLFEITFRASFLLVKLKLLRDFLTRMLQMYFLQEIPILWLTVLIIQKPRLIWLHIVTQMVLE